MKRTLKVNDFFCGCGGMGIAFKNAGYEIAGAWDFDKYAVETYRANVGDHAQKADIKELHQADIPKAATEYLAENMDGLVIGKEPEALRNWEAAEIAINDTLSKYTPGGYFGKIVYPVLMPLKERLEAGERTADLYNAIVEATR